MQASDLIGRIAVVMKTCGEEVLMSHLGVVLYEYLGEEYPEVLGSILGALKVWECCRGEAAPLWWPSFAHDEWSTVTGS